MSDPWPCETRERRFTVKLLVAVATLALAGCASPNGPGRYTQVPRTENCKPTSEKKIEALFDRWNESVRSGDAHKVVANYAEDSMLLPPVSSKVRLSPGEIEEYFEHFLADEPSVYIDLRRIYLGCNVAVDAGLYTFTFARTGQVMPARYVYTYRWDGEQWLITSHHSSALPEQQ
jgi:uncharacterized protein (TIGR02246 family)